MGGGQGCPDSANYSLLSVVPALSCKGQRKVRTAVEAGNHYERIQRSSPSPPDNVCQPARRPGGTADRRRLHRGCLDRRAARTARTARAPNHYTPHRSPGAITPRRDRRRCHRQSGWRAPHWCANLGRRHQLPGPHRFGRTVPPRFGTGWPLPDRNLSPDPRLARDEHRITAARMSRRIPLCRSPSRLRPRRRSYASHVATHPPTPRHRAARHSSSDAFSTRKPMRPSPAPMCRFAGHTSSRWCRISCGARRERGTRQVDPPGSSGSATCPTASSASHTRRVTRTKRVTSAAHS